MSAGPVYAYRDRRCDDLAFAVPRHLSGADLYRWAFVACGFRVSAVVCETEDDRKAAAAQAANLRAYRRANA